MIDLHRRAGTWARKVDRFIALTNFAARKFEQAGVPRRKIAVKPNFNLPAPVASGGPREGFLYVGRLSEEKGIATLAAAMKELGSEAALRVVGTGSEQRELEGLGSVTLLGQLSPEQVLQEMDRASALIVPSLWYEGFPMVLVEAFSRGLPVIASEIGALAELVEPHVNGLLFKTGISSDLASKIRWAVSHRVEMTEYGRRAREIYESRYTDEASYRTLMSIYEEVIREVRDESR
jgi:glycosyltransferase involved in cell wall biosynthesis